VGYPERAQYEQSTYLHLIDCHLEMKADCQLRGAERVEKVMNFWAGDDYTWVYKTVIRDERTLARIIEKQYLGIN
jgi:hypothetical protein